MSLTCRLRERALRWLTCITKKNPADARRANLMNKDEAPLLLPAGIEPAAKNNNATPQQPWSNPCQS
jgi:hypothetical protein